MKYGSRHGLLVFLGRHGRAGANLSERSPWLISATGELPLGATAADIVGKLDTMGVKDAQYPSYV